MATAPTGPLKREGPVERQGPVESQGLDERQWFIAERWQQYDGELRANLLRLAGIGAFYLIHLVNYYQSIGELAPPEAAAARQFHLAATAIAVAGTMFALAILLCLRHQIFPPWLMYASTAADLVLLTAVALLADGPRSPLVVGYFFIIVLAGLRFSLPLIRCATLGAVIGYGCLLGCAKWPETFGRGPINLRVPRHEQFMVLAALVLTGIVLGQIIRRVRSMAEEFIDRAARHEAAISNSNPQRSP